MRGLGLARYDDAVATFEKALEEADNWMPQTVRDITLYELSALYRYERYEEAVTICHTLLEERKALEPYYYLGAVIWPWGMKNRPAPTLMRL